MARVFELAYHRFNHPEYIHPDPLVFVYRFRDPKDMEVAGFIAASLAYGRVAQILTSASTVIDALGPSPAAFIRDANRKDLQRIYRGFKHRWTTDVELIQFLSGMGEVLRTYNSLQACYRKHAVQAQTDGTINGLAGLVSEIRQGPQRNSLLPDPMGGSACKRLFLFLRWMVRNDDVDPGVWSAVSPASLIVPLDTHMHRLARHFGLTERRQPNLRAALEVTSAFRQMVPDDPLRYDFALTRLGIRSELDLAAFVDDCQNDRLHLPSLNRNA